MSTAAMPPASSFVVPASTTVVQAATTPAVGSITYAAAPVTAGSVTYAAPTVTYAAAPAVTYAAAPMAASYTVPAGSVTYAAAPITSSVALPVSTAAPVGGSVVLPTGAASVTAPVAGSSITYAAPTTYASPLPPSDSFTISAERFQRILAGEPLSQVEIADLAKGQATATAVAAPAATVATVAPLAPVASTVVAAPSTVVPKVQTGVSNRSLASVASEEEPGVLQFLNESPYVAQAERIADKKGNGKEAFATLPIELTGKVPDDYKQGSPLVFQGPDGDIEVDVPADMSVPIGQSVTYRLKPQAELRIQVPIGRVSGELIQFKRADGLEIEVPIPDGVKEGDYFDADPPAVMVKVPENTAAGEYVTFQALRRDGHEVTDWCRAAVPQGVAPGKFFIARLPPPDKKESDSAKKSKGSKKKVKSSKKEKGCC